MSSESRDNVLLRVVVRDLDDFKVAVLGEGGVALRRLANEGGDGKGRFGEQRFENYAAEGAARLGVEKAVLVRMSGMVSGRGGVRRRAGCSCRGSRE